MKTNYYIIAAIIIAALALYFFVYKSSEGFDENIRSPHIMNIEFPNEGLVGAFIAQQDSVPKVDRKQTSDPTVFSLSSSNSIFRPIPGKVIKSITNGDGTVVGFFFKIVNSYPTSQY